MKQGGSPRQSHLDSNTVYQPCDYRVSVHTLHFCSIKLWSLSFIWFGIAHNKVLRYRLRGSVFLSPQGHIARAQIAMWSGYEHGFCVQDLMILHEMHEPKCEKFSSWTSYPLPSYMWHTGCWRRRVGIKSVKLHCSWDCITPLPWGQSFTHRSTSIRPLKQMTYS